VDELEETPFVWIAVEWRAAANRRGVKVSPVNSPVAINLRVSRREWPEAMERETSSNWMLFIWASFVYDLAVVLAFEGELQGVNTRYVPDGRTANWLFV
jgi:hypothetical protein